MLEQFWNSVFWHDKFDETWRHNSMFLKLPDMGWGWNRRIEEKRSFWREHGKKRQLTPRQAVFRAFEDIADTIYAEHSDKERMQPTWMELAYAQYYAASSAEWEGAWVTPEQRLSERWQPHYAAYREKRDAEEQENRRRAEEIQSHRFDRSEINDAWHKLLAGDVDRDVQAIWRHSEPPRRTGHEIASRAKVSVRDFVFWMVVLRDHGFMTETVVLDEHLYCNQRSWLEDRENLDGNSRLLINRLSGRNVDD